MKLFTSAGRMQDAHRTAAGDICRYDGDGYDAGRGTQLLAASGTT